MRIGEEFVDFGRRALVSVLHLGGGLGFLIVSGFIATIIAAICFHAGHLWIKLVGRIF